MHFSVSRSLAGRARSPPAPVRRRSPPPPPQAQDSGVAGDEPVVFRCAVPSMGTPNVTFGRPRDEGTAGSSPILSRLHTPPTISTPQFPKVSPELLYKKWLEMLAANVDQEQPSIVRVQRMYAHIRTMEQSIYNRRSSRGSGIKYLGGEKALVTSMDEYCYTKAMEPGFQFNDASRLLLYRQCLADAQLKGYWVLTSSGVITFPAGSGTIYLSDLCRRASEGYVFRAHVERMNRERDLESWREDWRAYYRHSRNIVDVGFIEKLKMGLRWRFNKTFGLALPRPPRQ